MEPLTYQIKYDVIEFCSTYRMLTDCHFQDLEKKGYTVVPNVVSPDDCDSAIRQYQEWLSQFKGGDWPKSFSSIINRYNTGHMAPTWEMRLKTKKVFTQLWKTDKLLTSFDAVSIGRPPEEGKEKFQVPGEHWLHADQQASRLGLHAYQGALYLEDQCEDDWTFQVMEGSHKFLHIFYEHYPDAARESESLGVYYLKADEFEFYKDVGFQLLRVPVPKGGMILWDSRLIHANARPVQNRKHPGRWRYTIFISMTPAIWASAEDIKEHREAYENAMMTSHWSSTDIVSYESLGRDDITYPVEVPEIGRSDEAKRLSGAIPYDFEDGQPNCGDYRPEWKCTTRRFFNVVM